MKDLFFWKAWSKKEQIIYWVLLILFLASFVLYFVAYFQGTDQVVSWDKETSLNTLDITLRNFASGILEIEVPAKAFVLEEIFATSDLEINFTAQYIYLIFMAIAMIVFLSVTPKLKSIWYAFSMTIFVFLVSQMGLDSLGINLGFQRSVTVVFLVAYIGLNFYFQSFNSNVKLLPRLLSFTLLTIALFTWVVMASEVAYPLLYVSNMSILIPMMLVLVFFTVIGQEFNYLFLRFITQYNTHAGGTNIVHFTLISLIFIGNIVLSYLHKIDFVAWDFYYLDVYFLYPIAGILGIWGFKRRSLLIRKILSFTTNGAFLYLALGIVSNITLYYIFATANTALISLFEDLLIFSFIGFGLGFLIYAMANFADVLRSKLDITKIIYQGKFFPYYMLRYTGFMALIIAFVSTNQFMLSQGYTGFYVSMGDVYYAHNENAIAQKMYYDATQNDFFDERARYSFSSIPNKAMKVSEMRIFLEKAIAFRKANPHTFLRVAEYYQLEERSEDAITTLKKALKFYPNNMYLHNNIAYNYALLEKTDSALYFYDEARKYAGKSSTVPQSNFWAFLAQHQIKGFDITKVENDTPIDDIIYKTNKLAAFNNYQKILEEDLSQNLDLKEFNAGTFAFAYNYTLNRLGKKDAKSYEILDSVDKMDQEKNMNFHLKFAKGAYYYYNQNVKEGIEMLAGNPSIRNEAYLNLVLGLWFLEQKNYKNSLPYFEQHKRINLLDATAIPYRAIALTKMREFEQANLFWTDINRAKLVSSTLSQSMLKILKDSSITDDLDKYNYIHYLKDADNDEERLVKYYNEITDAGLKVKSAAELINFYLDRGFVANAEVVYNNLNLKGLELNPYIESEINYAYLRILLGKEQYATLLGALDKRTLIGLEANKKPFLRALALQKTGKIKEANQYYAQAFLAAPYDINVAITSAEYYQNEKKNVEKAYDILVKTIRINPPYLPLHKAYSLQALRFGLENYALNTLREIKDMTSPEDFAKFKEIFDRLRAAEDKRRFGEDYEPTPYTL